MRIAELYVPEGCMSNFAYELGERHLENRIVGITEDDEIIVQIKYDKEQSGDIDQLETFLNQLIDELEDDENEEEDDEDNDN